jgi:hypothetical protein
VLSMPPGVLVGFWWVGFWCRGGCGGLFDIQHHPPRRLAAWVEDHCTTTSKSTLHGLQPNLIKIVRHNRACFAAASGVIAGPAVAQHRRLRVSSYLPVSTCILSARRGVDAINTHSTPPAIRLGRSNMSEATVFPLPSKLAPRQLARPTTPRPPRSTETPQSVDSWHEKGQANPDVWHQGSPALGQAPVSCGPETRPTRS